MDYGSVGPLIWNWWFQPVVLNLNPKPKLVACDSLLLSQTSLGHVLLLLAAC